MKTIYVDRDVMRIIQDRTIGSNGRIDSSKLYDARQYCARNIQSCDNNSQLQGLHYSSQVSNRNEASKFRKIERKLTEILTTNGDFEVKLR